jgi:hypothetical protein
MPIDRFNSSVENDAPRVFLLGGVRWSVYEHVMAYQRRTRPDLVFESDAVIRRVRNYPENWRSLSNEELWRLSWNS